MALLVVMPGATAHGLRTGKMPEERQEKSMNEGHANTPPFSDGATVASKVSEGNGPKPEEQGSDKLRNPLLAWSSDRVDFESRKRRRDAVFLSQRQRDASLRDGTECMQTDSSIA
jgi:hypothetical protein